MKTATSILGLIFVEDRYPNENEREQLIAFATSINARKTALLEIQKIEHQVALYCVETTHRTYPRFVQYHKLGKEKGIRDMQLLLGAAAKAMFLNDLDYLNNQVLIWIRTLFRALNFTPKFMLDTCNNLRDGVKKYGSQQTFQLMETSLSHMTSFLSDIPEPAVSEV